MGLPFGHSLIIASIKIHFPSYSFSTLINQNIHDFIFIFYYYFLTKLHHNVHYQSNSIYKAYNDASYNLVEGNIREKGYTPHYIIIETKLHVWRKQPSRGYILPNHLVISLHKYKYKYMILLNK